jgi:hypothetical protein
VAPGFRTAVIEGALGLGDTVRKKPQEVETRAVAAAVFAIEACV